MCGRSSRRICRGIHRLQNYDLDVERYAKAQQSRIWRGLPMTLEKQFGRWALIGVPSIFLEGIAVAFFVHLRYLIAWHDILPPLSICLTIQIGFFICAFWARRLAREQGRFGPISFLLGLSSWGTVLIVMHYGPLWGILAPVGDPLSFSIFMIFVALASWFVMNKTRRAGGKSPGDTDPSPK